MADFMKCYVGTEIGKLNLDSFSHWKLTIVAIEVTDLILRYVIKPSKVA